MVNKKFSLSVIFIFYMVFNLSYSECIPNRDSDNKISRSQKQVRKFKLQHPCPSTGLSKGACKGYVVDHIKPLCDCGSDTPENMQWQTYEDSKIKDIEELKTCRKNRHGT